ncbi:peptidylprolyl isomerase [Hymenobacter gummosus]|uniref:Peptidyl-prolyl cis-trans isomerase n=1 Tax=Hymenobacter gummosus TaxID=1776032 RepID=A0A431U203_9BACT|nr:peptidylprolyl isomerase [Hymenobacter gummosus]RTQ49201.1 peptidylprolyl isomerase [Hymenobacter gummosus]
MIRSLRFTGLLAAALWLGSAAASAQEAKTKTKTPKPSKKDEVVTLHVTQGGTTLGDIRLVTYEQTPLHRENFLKKAKSGFYSGTTFHRVIPGFMVQGGDANSKNADPNDDGMGQPNDPTVPAELRPELKHKQGALAAARMGGPPGTPSSSSQFYIVQNPGGTPFLDGAYTVFGQVIQGQDVVDKIVKAPRNEMDRPNEAIKMDVKVEKLSKKKITKLYGYQY